MMYIGSHEHREDIPIPENYSGTSLLEQQMPPQIPMVSADITNHSSAPTGFGFSEETVSSACPPPKASGVLDGWFAKLLPGGFPALHAPHIGAEEYLLIALAVYLFFASDGDKLCAVMLLALLFL